MRSDLKNFGVNVFLLGLASFFADFSSEMIVPILPLFIASLGGTGLMVGLIGGLSDSVVAFSKMLSGYYSDKIGKRKEIIIAGYAFSSLAKIFMAISTSALQILIFRPIERIGKGVREPPRDALVGKSYVKKKRGRAFGIIKTMDTSGAIIGSLAVFFLLYAMNARLNSILLIAGMISIIAVIPLFFIKDKVEKVIRGGLIKSLRSLPKKFKIYLLIASIFAFADFSYMFFILKAQDYFSVYYIPVMLYVLFNIAYAIFSYPIGKWSDKIGRRKVLAYGYALFALTSLLFIFSSNLALFISAFLLYGLAYAFIVSNERACASDLAPRKEMGTALGTFHMIIALVSLPSSLIAGLLWESMGHNAPFILAAVIALASAGMMLVFKKKVK